MDYLTKHDIIHKNYNGFRECYSIDNAISFPVEILYNELKKNKPFVAIFLDPQETFDIVDLNFTFPKTTGIRGMA